MPLNSAQLAALVERARLKPAPTASSPPPPQRPVRPREAKPATPSPESRPLMPRPSPAAVPPPPAPKPEQTAETEDFPVGWELKKDSWHFHRRFYAVFRRPMARGEYSHLLWQVRRGKAEHLGDDCWRVALPGGRTLPVRATTWRLITILPKNWQPPQPETQNPDPISAAVMADPSAG